MASTATAARKRISESQNLGLNQNRPNLPRTTSGNSMTTNSSAGNFSARLAVPPLASLGNFVASSSVASSSVACSSVACSPVACSPVASSSVASSSVVFSSVASSSVASSSVAPLGAHASAAVMSNARPYTSTTPTVMQTLSPSYLGVNHASQAAVLTVTQSMVNIASTSSRSQVNPQANPSPPSNTVDTSNMTAFTQNVVPPSTSTNPTMHAVYSGGLPPQPQSYQAFKHLESTNMPIFSGDEGSYGSWKAAFAV